MPMLLVPRTGAPAVRARTSRLIPPTTVTGRPWAAGARLASRPRCRWGSGTPRTLAFGWPRYGRGMSDVVFRNGHVFDGHRRGTSTCVAVRGSRFLAAGSEAEVLERAAVRAPRRSTCAAGLLMPGFHDAHMHPMVGGLERLRCELELALGAIDDYLRRDRRGAAQQRPDDAWLRGGGWSVGAFDPHGPDRRAARSGGARPARVPAEHRPPRCLGQHPGPARSPG